ncbi:MAG: ATP-grasp domain-containing protein [Clostridia bacterium]|nr:ATP-grasp domain-containing protein [Clostridia bacterium]
MRKVAVLFGGKSCENEISVLTGVFVLNVLDREKYTVLPVYIHTDGKTYTSGKMTDLEVFKRGKTDGFQRVFFEGGHLYSLQEKKGKIKDLGKVDAAINCCHGGLGEGGGVSALMAWNEVALASPDLTASGVFMDKCTTKLIAKALGIPTVEYVRVNEKDYEKRGAFLLKTVEARLKYPVVVKPARLGSSIGIEVVKNEEELKIALSRAFALDSRVIIERYLAGKMDVNCAAYVCEEEIVVSEPETAFGDGIYSFEEKYVKRTEDGRVKLKRGDRCALSKELRDKIRAYTKTLYKRMNLMGAVRMDYLVAEGKAYLCEVNTVPGSLAYYLFCERVSDAKNFLSDLIEEGIQKAEAEKKTFLSPGILKSVAFKRK